MHYRLLVIGKNPDVQLAKFNGNKWDYWVVGGRWYDRLITKGGQGTNQAFKKDIDVQAMLDRCLCEADRDWQIFTDSQRKYPLLAAISHQTHEQFIASRIESYSVFAVLRDGNWRETTENFWKTMEEIPDDELVTLIDCAISDQRAIMTIR